MDGLDEIVDQLALAFGKATVDVRPRWTCKHGRKGFSRKSSHFLVFATLFLMADRDLTECPVRKKMPGFPVNPLTGEQEEIVVFAGTAGPNTSGTFSLFWNGADNRFAGERLDGISIEFLNDPPVAQDDLFTVLEDGVLNGNVLADNGNGIDDDPNGDPLTVNPTPISGPSNGTLTLLATGDFTYTPFADFAGTDMFEYEIDDGNGETDIGKVTITVDPVNDEPSFVTQGDQNVLEDSGPHTVAGFATASPGGGPDEAGQTFTYNVSNDNNPLFNVQPAIDASGQLTYTLTPDANGTATVTVSVTDSGGTANGGDDTSPDQTFDIIVAAVNDEPSFVTQGDQNVLEDSGPHTVASFATASPGGGPDEAGQTFTYNVSNDNNPLFSVQPAIDASGQLTYTLTPDANGTATVTVSVTDSGGTANGGDDTSPDQTFDIIVAAVNDEPSFVTQGDQNVLEDSGPHTVAGFATASPGGGPDEAGQTFAYNVSNDNNPLFSVQPAIDASGQLTYTLTPDANGTATVTVSVTDSGGTANGGDDTSPDQTFDIIVAAVNDEPSITLGGNQTVNENDPAQTVGGFATGFSPGGGSDESGQVILDFVVSNDNNGLFSVQPDIDNSGTLTYTPAPSQSGSATVTVQVQDDGGTANGGVDLSVAQMFTISVIPPNLPPVITSSATANFAENAVGTVLDVMSTDDNDSEGAGLTYSFTSTGVGPGIDNGLFNLNTADGTITFISAPDFESPADFDGDNDYQVQVTVTDSGPGGSLTDTQDITITVTDVPEADAIDDSYTGIIGNVGLDVPSGNGVLSNDLGGASTVTQVNGVGANVGNPTATTNGTVTVQADGSFLYEPNAGNFAADSFTYEADGLDTATVNLTFGTDMIWFIDSTPSGAGNVGTLSDPFNSISAYNASTAGANQEVFIAAGSYTGPLNLNSNSVVIGEGATGTTATLLGVIEPTDSRALPSVGGTAPTITSTNATGISLASGNTIRGLDIGNTGTGTGISGGAVGSLTISDVSITGTGHGIDIATSGTLAVSFDEISSTNGTGIDLTSVSGSFDVTTAPSTPAVPRPSVFWVVRSPWA
jgi:hypothetical protein